jgi:hypothetical protein
MIAAMAPEQKKYQSDFVTEKVWELVGWTQRLLFIFFFLISTFSPLLCMILMATGF